MVQGQLLFCTWLVVPAQKTVISPFYTVQLGHGNGTAVIRQDGAGGVLCRSPLCLRRGRGRWHSAPHSAAATSPEPQSPPSALPQQGLAATLPHHTWRPAAARGGHVCRSSTSPASAPTAAALSSAMAAAAGRLRLAEMGPCFPSSAPEGRPGGRGLPWCQATRPALGLLQVAGGRQ